MPYKKTILQQHQDYLLSKAKTDVANGPTGELKQRSVSPIVQSDPKRINRVFGGDMSNSTLDNNVKKQFDDLISQTTSNYKPE